jgi:SAM-dependent methyltransferase
MKTQNDMKLFQHKFRPEWPRIFLDSALQDALLSLPLTKGKCLNIGCGTEGRYRELLAGFEVSGVDIANPKGKFMPWSYYQCDASKLPFDCAHFDLGIAIESFEHIDSNNLAMQELARALKSGAWLVITTPTQWTWLFEFGRHGPHYYSQTALNNLLKKNGFEVLSCKPLGGGLFWTANLVKSWVSPIGLRLFPSKWWLIIDTILIPLYWLSKFVDRLFPFPPTNWLFVAKKIDS